MKKKIINFGNYSRKINKRKAFICGIKSLKLSSNEISFLRKFKPWGIILFSRNIKNVNQVINLTTNIKKIFNDDKYPILVDEEGGRVTRLKNIIDNSYFDSSKFGKFYNKDKKKFRILITNYIKQTSLLLKTLGININTIPVLDIRRNKLHKIIGDRSYSNNPKTVSIIGDLVIREFTKNKINTIMKHIPGHGLAKVDSHKKLPFVNKSLKYLIKNDFYPFKKKKCLIAMTAHIKFNQIDNTNCTTHSKKVIKIIRDIIKFKSLIISDDISMKALKHSLKINTLKAFEAGCNIVMHCNAKINEMKIVAANAPFLDDFIIKKTSHLRKKLS